MQSLRRLVLHQHATPGWEKIQTCRQLNTKGLRAEHTGELRTLSPFELDFHASQSATSREVLQEVRFVCGNLGVCSRGRHWRSFRQNLRKIRCASNPVWYQAVIWKLSDQIWIWFHLWAAGFIPVLRLRMSRWWDCSSIRQRVLSFLPSELVTHQTL